MANSARPVPLLGRIALHLKLIDLDQLEQATREQARRGDGHNLGNVLVELGFVDEAGLQKILRARQQVVAKHRAKQGVAEADPVPEVAPTAPAAAPPAADPGGSIFDDDPVAPPAATPESADEGIIEPTAHAEVAEPVGGVAAPASAPAASPSPVSAGPAGPGLEGLHARLRQGVERGASDVHIHSGTPLRLRLAGRFEAQGDEVIPADAAEEMVLSALSPEQRATFEELGELDFAYTAPDLGRFRVNVYRQQRGIDGVFRCLPTRPPSLEELGLPGTLAKFTNYHQGLVLVTGPANCGKSSTLAAMVDIINEERREHILTIEDPIEVVHPPKRCVVNQRNVGRHTESFARALRGALREDPDVIVIGELRDLETVSLALTAAETGHLVLGTLHTNSAIRTLNRIVGVFPADQQDQIRNMVSESLRAVVSQRLVPTADGNGRVPALEMLVVNKAVGNLIRENKTFQILSILQTGASQGMCLLDDSLKQLIADGSITREEALKHCDDPKRLGGA
ncbi:MAG: type IV pilus twitching motility protein PilT [Myxococcota bacterium]|nr:type IV pilus twitching motility protein PilT [Myxococcota bacterium]